MDYKLLFEKQHQFDLSFMHIPKSERIRKKFVAVISELGEMLNEKPNIYKFWSSQKKASSIKNAEKYAALYERDPIYPQNDHALEELSDIFHFVLSLGNELGVSEQAIVYLNECEMIRSDKEEEELIMNFLCDISFLYTAWESSRKVEDEETRELIKNSIGTNYIHVFFSFLCMVEKLGYKDAMEAEYHRKNDINFTRQSEGY